MKRLLYGAWLLAMAAGHGAAADRRVEPLVQAAPEIAQYSDNPFAAPLPLLPLRHQNHCGYQNGHYVCADHCGVDYQIYYCSPAATGCCHVGLGYCDADGQLRCSSSPSPF